MEAFPGFMCRTWIFPSPRGELPHASSDIAEGVFRSSAVAFAGQHRPRPPECCSCRIVRHSCCVVAAVLSAHNTLFLSLF